MKLKSLYLLLLVPLLAFSLHKYYISLCEIDYIPEKQSIEITMGLFVNDLEYTLMKDFNVKINLNTKEESPSSNKYFKAYLNEHFKVIVNNVEIPFDYIGKEYDDDIIRFYLEIANVPKLNSIEVFNNCLIRDFQDQQNIIKINANKKQKTFYLDNKTYKGLLKL
ncbi:DUF6702 family protein [Lutibacter citreus]|uniref:DUF6702 family protein n=1 Tax=Lutibacter citreus TaxID=2138210 RepID=UPI000DBE4361|nr:DUF6702 family protein [Lutibacter citreus]